jgi:hypothetical protein
MQDRYVQEWYMEVGWTKWAGDPAPVGFTSVKNRHGYHYDSDTIGQISGQNDFWIRWSDLVGGWDLKYRSLTVHTAYSDLNISKVGCGGVTTSTANALGVAACKSAYTAAGRDSSGYGGNWVVWGNHYTWASDPGYWVNSLYNNSWQIGGRN